MRIPFKVIPLQFAVAFAVLCAPSLAHAVSAPSGTCGQYMLIGARGTGEPSGFGSLLGPIVTNIQSNARPTVSTYALPYPAGTDFTTSEMQGVTDLENYLSSQSTACPAQKFVLLGYSQGAQVVGTALASPTLTALASRISAITLFGDPNFNSAEKYDVGSYRVGTNGVSGARRTGSLSLYASTIQNYCNGTDGICQAGQSLSGHLTYQNTAATPAEQFVLGKIN